MKPPYHILLADDDECIRKLFVDVLIQAGYRVDTANDGVDAWAALNHFSYDLLITDHEMPWLKGLDLIKKLRSANMVLPVILATAMMPEDELKECPDLRIEALLSKPFTLGELLDAVNKLLPQAESGNLPGKSNVPAILQAINEIDPLPRGNREPPPVAKASEATVAGKSARAPIRNRMNSPHCILVVNDESDVRQLTMDVLANSGYEVEGAKDGAAGWEALQAKAYDLVITDNKMPRMTGIEMIENLRDARMTIPVIMATGCLPVFDFVRKPWLKPDGALQQPYSNDDLVATVKKVLGSSAGKTNAK